MKKRLFYENQGYIILNQTIIRQNVSQKGGTNMPRKGENIYHRRDGRWEGRYIKSRQNNGKACYGYVYAKTYREVKEKLIKRKQESHIALSNPSSKLFKDIAREWFDQNSYKVKESTSNKYWNLLYLYIIPRMGNLTLTELTAPLLEKQCRILLEEGGAKKQGLSYKTVADILSLMRMILKYAQQNGSQIAIDMSLFQCKRQSKEMRILSRSEQEKLYQYLYSHITPGHIGILICLFTGLRIGEVCALRWEDISFSESTLHVSKTLQRIQNRSNHIKKTKIVITSSKSNSAIRIIPLTMPLIKILASYQTVKIGYVLTNSPHIYMEPRTMQNHFQKALRTCGIAPANYHALRHTFATRCVEVGFDVKSLSEILGHASVNITMNRYVHPSLELKRENMERFSHLFTVNLPVIF